IEMMDNLAIQAAEASVHAGYPNCGGLLLVELDGPGPEVEHLIHEVSGICTQCGAWEIRVAQSDAERAIVWKGRKAAFAAMGRISPNYIVQDGVIPRTALPLVLYDGRIPGQEERAMELSINILRLCVACGGSITGEHGVGEEKKMMMGEMFAEPDLETMQLVRCAFDPERLSNPGKVFPRTRLCAEKTGPYQPHPLEVAGVAQFF